MKKPILIAAAVIALFILLLSSSVVSDQGEKWALANPKDPHAPEVLYRAARWCDIMGDDDKAVEIYWKLYETYPQNGDLVAPALYYSAKIKANSGTIVALRKQANSYLDILLNQYSGQTEWHALGQKLYDEVNYVH